MTNKKWEKIERRAQRRNKAARRHHRAVSELADRMFFDSEQIDPKIQRKILSQLHQ